MRLMQIRYFLATADCKSITKASERMFVSQPALSKQLNELEKELGVTLLVRNSRGIELTEAGTQFAEELKAVISDLDAAVSRVMIYGGSRRKELRIGCFDGAVIDDFMPALYAHLHTIAPELKVRLIRRSMEENRAALKTDDIDLLIEIRFPNVSYNDLQQGYNSKVLINRQGALIYSPNSPLARVEDLTIEDFRKEPFFVSTRREERELTRHSLQTLASLGIPDPLTETADNLISILSNIKLGHGYYLLAKDVAIYDPQLLAFELPEQYGIHISAVWKKENALISSLIEAFSIKQNP